MALLSASSSARRASLSRAALVAQRDAELAAARDALAVERSGAERLRLQLAVRRARARARGAQCARVRACTSAFDRFFPAVARAARVRRSTNGHARARARARDGTHAQEKALALDLKERMLQETNAALNTANEQAITIRGGGGARAHEAPRRRDALCRARARA